MEKITIKDIEHWIENNYSKCFDKKIYKELVSWFSVNYKLDFQFTESKVILPGIRIITISGINDEVKNKLINIINNVDNIVISNNVSIEDLKNYPKGTVIYFGEGLDIKLLLDLFNQGVILETLAFMSSKEKSNELLKHIIYASQNIRTYIIDTYNINNSDQLDIIKSVINGDI